MAKKGQKNQIGAVGISTAVIALFAVVVSGVVSYTLSTAKAADSERKLYESIHNLRLEIEELKLKSEQ